MSRRNREALPDWREMAGCCAKIGQYLLAENPDGVRADLLAYCADLIVYLAESRRIERRLRRRAEGRAPAKRR